MWVCTYFDGTVGAGDLRLPLTSGDKACNTQCNNTVQTIQYNVTHRHGTQIKLVDWRFTTEVQWLVARRRSTASITKVLLVKDLQKLPKNKRIKLLYAVLCVDFYFDLKPTCLALFLTDRRFSSQWNSIDKFHLCARLKAFY